MEMEQNIVDVAWWGEPSSTFFLIKSVIIEIFFYTLK